MLSGPNFETPAELTMLKSSVGVDAVGTLKNTFSKDYYLPAKKLVHSTIFFLKQSKDAFCY